MSGRLNAIGSWIRDPRWFTAQRVRAYSKLILAAYAMLGVFWTLSSRNLIDPSGTPLGADFVAMWSASAMAIRGAAASAYDPARLLAVQRAMFADPQLHLCAFFYPPTYLLMIAPLAGLPYGWSLIAWIGLSLAAYLFVIRKIAPVTEALLIAVAFPGALVNFVNGQNGFLTAALLGGALIALQKDRPVLCGVFFGLLGGKPQLGLLIPMFLLVTRQWRAIASTSIATLILVASSVALFGPETWRGFIAGASSARHLILEQGEMGFFKMQSVFAQARMWGLSVAASYALQGLVATAAIAMAIRVWTACNDFPIRAAALVIATMLVTPWMYDYDLVLLALPIAYLAIDAMREGFLPFQKSILTFAWLMPMLARPLANAAIPIAPVVLMLLLWITLRRARFSVRGEGNRERSQASKSMPLAAQFC